MHIEDTNKVFIDHEEDTFVDPETDVGSNNQDGAHGEFFPEDGTDEFIVQQDYIVPCSNIDQGQDNIQVISMVDWRNVISLVFYFH